MSKVADKIMLIGTYMCAIFNLTWDFELIKSIIIFIATMALLIIQIKVHLKRLKKENEKEDNSNAKKN